MEKLRVPISAEAPSGRDARYDEDYSLLKAEIDKLTAGIAEDGIDYRQITDLCRGILQGKSRDLAVSGFLAWALFRQEGYPGLGEALEATEILLRDFWDTLFPPTSRMVGRKNAIDWLNLRVSEQVEAGDAYLADYTVLSSIDERLKSLSNLLLERFHDLRAEDRPTLAALSRAIQGRLRFAKPPSAATTAAGMTSATPASPGEISSDTEAEDAARRLVDYFAAQSPLSPVAFRLPRLLRWDGLTNEPPNEQGRTLLPPPRDTLRMQLEALAMAASWSDLLVNCRDAFFEDSCHFWLDLQRFTDRALEQMGTEAGVLRQALLRDLASLLIRIPSLPQLSFSDGTAFANEVTRSWIETSVKPSLASGPETTGSPQPGEDSELQDHFKTARKAASAGKLTDALRLLQQGLDEDGRIRTRFVRRYEIARLLLEAGRATLAVAILEELAAEVDQYNLSAWERDLAVKVWISLLEGLKSTASSSEGGFNEDLGRRMDDIRNKICLVDIQTALATTGRS